MADRGLSKRDFSRRVAAALGCCSALHPLQSVCPRSQYWVVPRPHRCSRGNGLCTCQPDNTRCNTIKPFFETAVGGCEQASMQTCGNNYGYKSCYVRPDQTCRTDQCWLWALEVMAVCPEFYPDLSERLPPSCRLSPPHALALPQAQPAGQNFAVLTG